MARRRLSIHSGRVGIEGFCSVCDGGKQRSAPLIVKEVRARELGLLLEISGLSAQAGGFGADLIGTVKLGGLFLVGRQAVEATGFAAKQLDIGFVGWRLAISIEERAV